MNKEDKQAMLTSAFMDIVQSMHIPDATVTKMLGVDSTYVDKLRKSQETLDPHGRTSKDLAQFIGAMDQLFKLVGRKEGEAINWLNCQNKAFNNRAPLDLITNEKDGLERVSKYLRESYRGH